MTAVSGKLQFGSCPQVSSITYNTYSAALAGSTTGYLHKFLYMDSEMFQGLEILKSLLGDANVKALYCMDLFSNSAMYYPDAAAYNKLFVTSSSDTIYRLMGFEATAMAETWYFCMDNKHYQGIAKFVISMGIPIPLEIVDAIMAVANFLNFLDVTVRFDGFFIWSNTLTPTAASVNNIKAAVNSVGGFSFDSDVKIIPKTMC
jgi:hypothetical protein